MVGEGAFALRLNLASPNGGFVISIDHIPLADFISEANLPEAPNVVALVLVVKLILTLHCSTTNGLSSLLPAGEKSFSAYNAEEFEGLLPPTRTSTVFAMALATLDLTGRATNLNGKTFRSFRILLRAEATKLVGKNLLTKTSGVPTYAEVKSAVGRLMRSSKAAKEPVLI